MPVCWMFHLPDGSYIKASSHTGGVNAHESDERTWMSADLIRVFPGGKEVVLCSVDYEDGKGLRAFVWREENGIPVFEHRFMQNLEVQGD